MSRENRRRKQKKILYLFAYTGNLPETPHALAKHAQTALGALLHRSNRFSHRPNSSNVTSLTHGSDGRRHSLFL
jgi:hypothetical protein